VNVKLARRMWGGHREIGELRTCTDSDGLF